MSATLVDAPNKQDNKRKTDSGTFIFFYLRKAISLLIPFGSNVYSLSLCQTFSPPSLSLSLSLSHDSLHWSETGLAEINDASWVILNVSWMPKLTSTFIMEVNNVYDTIWGKISVSSFPVLHRWMDNIGFSLICWMQNSRCDHSSLCIRTSNDTSWWCHWWIRLLK